MKISQVITRDFQDAVKNLAQEKLPMPVAYKIKKIIKKCNEELGVYQELLKKIQADTLKEDKTVDEDSFKLLYQDLIDTEFEMDTIKLDDIKAVSISTKDLLMLEPIITE